MSNNEETIINIINSNFIPLFECLTWFHASFAIYTSVYVLVFNKEVFTPVLYIGYF